MISQETAERLIKAFGPCSLVYECMSPLEVQKSIDEDSDGNLASWIEVEIDVQEIHFERDLAWVEDDAEHAALLHGNDEFIQDIKHRLKEAGFPCN